MAAETQYTANTGCGTVITANASMDASAGSVITIFTASNAAGMVGCIIKSITLKAQVTTTQGMVRLFITGGGSTELINEIEIPAVIKSATDPSFELYMETNFFVKAGYVLKATTANSEAINVIAEGVDVNYYTSSVRPESTKYTANTGMVAISTVNTGLDGNANGAFGTVLSAAANGTNIQSVTIKATGNTTAGMVRLFIYNSSVNYLLSEIPITATTASATAHSFSRRVLFNGNDFALKSGYLLKATTEKGEAFNVIAEGADWAYPA